MPTGRARRLTRLPLLAAAPLPSPARAVLVDMVIERGVRTTPAGAAIGCGLTRLSRCHRT